VVWNVHEIEGKGIVRKGKRRRSSLRSLREWGTEREGGERKGSDKKVGEAVSAGRPKAMYMREGRANGTRRESERTVKLIRLLNSAGRLDTFISKSHKAWKIKANRPSYKGHERA